MPSGGLNLIKTEVRDSRFEIRKINGLMMCFAIPDPRVSSLGLSEGVAEDSEAGGWPNE